MRELGYRPTVWSGRSPQVAGPTGALGRSLLAQCQTLWLRQDDYYAADWRGTWGRAGGGTTLGHGIHQIDLLAHLMGDWAEVDAHLWRLARDIEMEDVSTGTKTPLPRVHARRGGGPAPQPLTSAA